MVARPNRTLVEKRSALRLGASQVPQITGVRLVPPDARSTLLNISTSGILVECESRPRPGSEVTVHFEGTFSPASIRGRIARTLVASLGKDGKLQYLAGIAFDHAISLDQPPPPDAAMPELIPVVEHVSSELENRW